MCFLQLIGLVFSGRFFLDFGVLFALWVIQNGVNIENFLTHSISHSDGLGRAAVGSAGVGYEDVALICQKEISLPHTALCVFVADVDDLVCRG